MEGQYDIRKGAANYVQIVSTFGSLAVPGIILFFTVHTGQDPLDQANKALTVGLLVIGFVGSLLGSFAFAAIGAERDPTGNLAAASMFAGTCTSMAIISILAAFEVLAAAYIPDSATLFALITVTGGVFGGLFTGTVVSDATGLGPLDPAVRTTWTSQQWPAIRSRPAAYRMAQFIAAGVLAASALIIVLRLTVPRLRLTSHEANALVGAGAILLMLMAAAALFRTSHEVLAKDQKGLRHYEAFGSVSVILVWTAAVVLVLP